MKKFRIEVTEVLCRVVETEEKAVATIMTLYQNCNVVLDASDYVRTELA